ncbi:MAG TPA: cache domain-containing protein [Solirubrobacteraceae bacterium]|nr:cache domain-containing protein [Solirubrobacteraceae bacterium]
MNVAEVRPAGELLGDVIAELDRVFGALAELGAAFGALAGEPLRRSDVETLRPAIFALLADHADLVTGAGVVTAPGLLADAARWLEWWWGAGPEPLRVNLDPAAPDFYDYTTTEWFAATAPCTAGPYVDYACTNEYAITLSVPVPGSGVAAADVLVTSLERRVLPALVALDRPTALTNGDGRIIASNDPDLAPGLRVDAHGPGWLLVATSVS